MNKIWTITGTFLVVSVLFASSFIGSAEAKGKPLTDKATGIKLVECSVIESSLDCNFFTKDGIDLWLVSHPTGEETILIEPDCQKKRNLNLDPISEGAYQITVGECNAGDTSTFEIVISGGAISGITLQ